MKDFLLPLALLSAVGTGLWFFATSQQNSAGLGPRADFLLAASAKPILAKVVPDPPPLKTKEPPPPTAWEAEKDEPAQIAAAPAPVPPPPPPPVRVLPPDTIQPGMDVEQITELLGQPDLQTTTSEHGSLRQVYVYRRTLGNRVTYLHLLDGRVESTETGR